MYSIAFWKIWPAVYQRLFGVVLGLLILAQAFLWVSNFRSPAPVIEQQHFQQLEPLEIAVYRFQQGTSPLTLSTEAFLVFEHVFGGPVQPNLTASYFFLILLLTGIIFILTVLTTLPRFWFFMGIGLFILVVGSFRLDALELFGLTSKIPVVAVLAVYSFFGYYFLFLRPATPFFKRWATFALITLALGACIVFFARIHEPFIYLAANGLVAGTVLTIIFIFMVAHEIVASFVFVVTRRGARQKKSLQHFLIITAIYLVNLALIYADKKHVVEWDFFPFSLFLLITISGILGVWGFRQREPQYESIVRADPYGVYFFVAMAGIGFATMAYFLASDNDPGIQLFQDAILYSHLGYGLIFLIYIIVNFLSLLGGNLQVHKVLYKPTVMPYFTFRFAGLITTFAFFAYSNWKVSVNQAYAGYYNALGDFHLSQDTALPAEGYYQRSVYFAMRNYHAHYALAQFLDARGEYEMEKQEYTRLSDGRPLDLAYLNLSQLYASDNSPREAARVLKQGLLDFPKNGLLQNALSLVDSRLGLRDSAVLMANAARSSTQANREAETNLAGFSAKFLLPSPVDSMMDFLNSNHPGVKSNVLALATLQGKRLALNVDPGSDTLLTVYSSTALNNYLINRLNPVDTALVSKTIGLARRPSNVYFKTFLLSAAAHAYYRHGQTAQAFKLMHEIAFLGQQPKYYNALGLWALEQGATQNAVHFLDEAIRLNWSTSYFNRAVALTEAGDFVGALTAWDSLRRSGDPEIQKHAADMVTMLHATPQQALSFNDEEKFEFSRLRFFAAQGEDFEKFINTITDQGVRARAVVDRSKRLEETDDTGLALAAFALVKGLQFPDKDLYEEILHLNLRFLAKQQKWSLLEQQLHSGLQFEGFYWQDKLYFDALLSEQAGKKEEAAKKFAWLANANPFFEDAVVAAVRFFNKNGEDKLKTYTVLMNALDQNPNSVKLLKAYILQSASVGFEESAQNALDKLKTLLHPQAFLRFIDENPEIFEITTN